MPSLADVARFFAALPTVETLIGLGATAAILVILSDWRLSLLTLAVQYVLVAVLLSTAVRLEIALVRIVAGVLASSILFISARQHVGLSRATRKNAGLPPAFLIGWPFRAVALVMVGATVIALSTQMNLFNMPILFWLLGLWLMGTGLVIIILTRDVVKLGVGLLTFSSGFGALYLLLDPGLPVYGLLNMMDLVIALGIAHLASVPGPEASRRRRGEP